MEPPVPPGTQPEPLSNAGASIAFPVRLRPWAFRAPASTLASSVCPYVRAFFVALYWPGPLTVGANSSGNLLPSLVQMAPSPVAVLDTSYGASWVWMWNQRERSLTPPCSLMALIR